MAVRPASEAGSGWTSAQIGLRILTPRRSLEAVLPRLSYSSESALHFAANLQARLNQGTLEPFHLLAGLFQKEDGPARSLLTLFDSAETVQQALETQVAGPESALVPFAAVPGWVERDLTSLEPTRELATALLWADRLVRVQNSEQIRSRHLLAGLIVAPGTHIGGWIAQRLDVDLRTLVVATARTTDGAPDLDAIRRASRRADAPVVGQVHALVIGINEYDNTSVTLSEPVPVARSMAQYLQGNTAIAGENLHILLDREATRSAILQVTQRITSQVGPGDDLVFFFVGHGIKTSESGESALVAYDSLETEEHRGITGAALFRLLQEATSRGAHLTVILDANYAGDMGRYASDQITLLTSCGAEEHSYSASSSGAILAGGGRYSYFLLEALSNTPGSQDWQQIHEQVQANLSKQLPGRQTPHAFGNLRRPIFGGRLAVAAAASSSEQTQTIPTVPYHITLTPPDEEPLLIGREYAFTLHITPALPTEEPNLRVPLNALELTAFVEAAGFRLAEERIHRMRVVDGELPRADRTLTLHLMPLLGGRRTVGVQIDPGGRVQGAGPLALSCTVVVEVPEALPDVRELVDQRAIPHPQPDVMLYLSMAEAKGRQMVQVHATVPRLGVERREVARLALAAADLAGLRRAAVQAAAASRAGPQRDGGVGMKAFGAALFDQLLPPDSPLRTLYWRLSALNDAGAPLSWLIIADEEALLPWEMVLPYGEDRTDDFWGGCFVLTHWIGRQNFDLAAEMPLFKLDVTHYQQHRHALPAWAEALGGDELVHVETQAGRLALLEPGTPYYGLHLLRYTERGRQGRIATAPGATVNQNGQRDGESDPTRAAILYERRVDFSRRRPLVGLSFVDEDGTAPHAQETRLERHWMAPLLHAGATALVGSRWPLPPEMDQYFFRAFYAALREGASLGVALHTARDRLRCRHPHQPHWLAYAGIGHPRCRPYLVQPAQGFALFEVLDHPVDEPLQPGQTYAFRASYRLEAPVWYQGRLKGVNPTFMGKQIAVRVMPLDGSGPRPPQPLAPAPGGDAYHTVVDLTMPDDEPDLPVLVRFEEEGQELATLSLELEIALDEAAVQEE